MNKFNPGDLIRIRQDCQHVNAGKLALFIGSAPRGWASGDDGNWQVVDWVTILVKGEQIQIVLGDLKLIS